MDSTPEQEGEGDHQCLVSVAAAVEFSIISPFSPCAFPSLLGSHFPVSVPSGAVVVRFVVEGSHWLPG